MFDAAAAAQLGNILILEFIFNYNPDIFMEFLFWLNKDRQIES